ncbi:DUF4245 family protein [Nocardioides stalactiti]|uniref:DUF4245 family protein n=1 Tax=Nocardioides stalactiti TaxID=2755356 RepID=UPI001602B173|nr:DUF4245 family protein [Nocardioides stalactiti]
MSDARVGRPGRYQRSVGGLVAALVLTVVAVGGLVWLLGLFRSDLEVEREPVDYLDEIAALQGAGIEPVYPATLPGDWVATSVDTRQGFQLQMLTGDDEFVGIVQDRAEVSALLDTFVDEDAPTTEIITVPASVIEAWQGYEDEGGDTAYAATLGEDTILVYGSASPAELEDLIGRLTTDPVED